MELHRISLWFEFMVVRLVSEGDALTLKLLQPLAVDLDTSGSGSRGVVPEDIAHVVEQPGGHKDDRGRAMLAAVDTIYENFCASMTAIKSCCFFAAGSEPRSSASSSTPGWVAT